jgi:nitrogen regulatory protein P-II 1
MKYIIAIIRPEKLEAVQQALNEHEIYLMTVSDVRGCGRQRGFTETYRGNEVVIRLLSKVKLEIAVNEDYVARTIETIASVGKTGKIGDGKIFVLPLEHVTRIRTGETGNVAIGP